MRAAAPLSIVASATAIFSRNRSRIGRWNWPGSLRELERDEPGRGVQHHDVADRTTGAGEHLVHDRGVVRGVAARELVDRRARDAEFAGIEVVLLHRAARDLPDVAVPGGGELVESVVAAEHQRGRATRLEHADDQRHAVEVGDADGGCLGPSRIAERAEVVEHGGHAELGAHGARVPEAGMERGRVGERDARFVEHGADPLGGQRQVESQRGEHIG